MQVPQTFCETPGKKLACVFIDTPELSRAYDRLISLCTDVVFVDARDRFVLAYRVIDSAQGWWWKGGGMRKGETIDDSRNRLMKREVGFVPDGILILDQFFHQWDRRAEAPFENGKHDFIFLSFVKVNEDTIAKIRLDPSEYDPARGLMRYDGTQDVRPAVKAAYELYRKLHAPKMREALGVLGDDEC